MLIYVLAPLPPVTSPALANRVRSVLSRSGFSVRIVSPADLSRPGGLKAASCGLLVAPHSESFPAQLQANLLAYLGCGGKLLCVGGPPFSRYVYPGAHGWESWNSLVSQLAGSAMTGINPASAWTHTSTAPGSASTLSTASGPNGPSLRMDMPVFRDWEYFSPPPFARSPFVQRSDLFLFRAKGDSNTHTLVVEWRERDGARWVGAVPITTTWKRYALSPEDFHYWPDNPSKGRGGPGDRFHPENTAGLSIGLAQSFVSISPGPKRLWIADIRVARSPYQRTATPVLESLSPAYKLRNSQPGQWAPIERYRGAVPIAPPGRLSMTGGPAGAVEWLYRPAAGPYKGAVWGASNQPEARLQLLPQQVRAMLGQAYAAYGGPSAACYWSGEPVEFVTRLVNQSASSLPSRCTLQLQLVNHAPLEMRTVVYKYVVAPRSARTFQMRWPRRLQPGDYRFFLSLAGPGSSAIDDLSGRFTVLPAKPVPQPMVIAQGSEFVLNGKPWRPIGVNYWPLWISGQDPAENWREWLLPDRYDPELIERDLKLAQQLGINTVSVLYLNTVEARPLNDFLSRCRAHHIRANVFLGGGNPLASDTRLIASLITAARLNSNDAVWAYDIAWEPRVGSHAERKRLDPEWERWVLDNYGSIARAERDWGMSAPRESGRLTNPSDAELMRDGSWRRRVAAYRRFMDDRIGRGYRDVRRAIRAVDGRRLIGARSGYGGNGSLYAEGVMAFDLRSGGKYLDFISPEGYALSGEWKGFRDGGGFTTAYARWAGNGKPVYWAEFGQSVYPQTPEKLSVQAAEFDKISRMVITSGADGEAGWWWPGGLRVDETSDYGIIDPAGTPRPAALRLQYYARQNSRGIAPPAGERIPLEFDRDRDSRGYAGISLLGLPAYGAARDRGQFPTLRTSGTGTTTATMPLEAVGNVPADGVNPLKYCNADFNDVRALPSRPGMLRVSVSVGNTGETSWVNRGPGRVALVISMGDRTAGVIALPAPVPRFGDLAFPPFELSSQPGASLTLRLAILGRSALPLPFGEKITVH